MPHYDTFDGLHHHLMVTTELDEDQTGSIMQSKEWVKPCPSHVTAEGGTVEEGFWDTLPPDVKPVLGVDALKPDFEKFYATNPDDLFSFDNTVESPILGVGELEDNFEKFYEFKPIVCPADFPCKTFEAMENPDIIDVGDLPGGIYNEPHDVMNTMIPEEFPVI